MLTINSSLCLHNLQSHRTRQEGCCRVRCGCTEHLYLMKALAGPVRCVWNQCLRGSRVCTGGVEVPNTCLSKSLFFYGKAYHTCNSQQHASGALQPPPTFQQPTFGMFYKPIGSTTVVYNIQNLLDQSIGTIKVPWGLCLGPGTGIMGARRVCPNTFYAGRQSIKL